MAQLNNVMNDVEHFMKSENVTLGGAITFEEVIKTIVQSVKDSDLWKDYSHLLDQEIVIYEIRKGNLSMLAYVVGMLLFSIYAAYSVARMFLDVLFPSDSKDEDQEDEETEDPLRY